MKDYESFRPQAGTVPDEPTSMSGNLREIAMMRRMVQRRVDRSRKPVASPDKIAVAAERGVEGAGSALPHLDAIQKSFGPRHDVSGIRAHVGNQAADASKEMGAEAYATGNEVAFQSAPDLHTAAHEAAHVVQQRHGVQLLGGVGEVGDEHEKNADEVADRVVKGESAEDLLPAAEAKGTQKGVQKFTPLSGPELDGNEWQTGAGDGVRVSDDGMLAVAQESKYGSQMLYADEGLIESASEQLMQATSVIRLKAAEATISGKVPGTEQKKSLKRVVPVNEANNTQGAGGMELWADCGRSAGDVMGSGKGQGGGSRGAVYNDAEGNKVMTPSEWPVFMKWDIIGSYFKNSIDWPVAEDLKSQYLNAHAELSGVPKEDEAKAKAAALKDQITMLEGQIQKMIFAEYNKLSEDQKEAFDQKVGINRFAMPEVGQGFTISTGGRAKPGMEKKTWNFHWGGVVMRSGGDAVVLENYSVGEFGKENTDWKFQMYGPPSKKGQTFHEQHKDEHGQHGQNPTTMTVEPRK